MTIRALEIGRQTDVWIPLLSAMFETGSRMDVEMAPTSRFSFLIEEMTEKEVGATRRN
jgi:hypothetical protein